MRIVSDERLNALIVLASAPLMGQVRDLIALLDTPTDYESDNLRLPVAQRGRDEGGRGLERGHRTDARAEASRGPRATAEIQPFEKKVQITSYEDGTAAGCGGAPGLPVIRELIAQLDVPPRQVHVDAVIMEVTISDNLRPVVSLRH